MTSRVKSMHILFFYYSTYVVGCYEAALASMTLKIKEKKETDSNLSLFSLLFLHISILGEKKSVDKNIGHCRRGGWEKREK